MNHDMTLDGGDQFKGSNVRVIPSKNVYTSGGPAPTTTSLPEMMTITAAGSGQVNPHNSSSQYLQQGTIKAMGQLQQASGK
jgi:hypothetical protein